jgi:hypothetical protein
MPNFPSSQIWKLKDLNKFVRGDLPYPSVDEASSLWKLREAMTARSLGIYPNNDPVPQTSGSAYASSYLATTGGSLIEITIPGSLNATLDNASDGDAILLKTAGTYTVNNLQTDAYGSCPWRLKNVLIAGDTEDASDFVVEFTKTAQRGMHLFAGGNTTSPPSINKQGAFITFYTQNTSGTSYINALVAVVSNGSTAPPKGRLVNCYIDQNTGDISWHYNNGNEVSIDVEFVRCTFANYTNWDASYSGRDDVITVTSSLFDGTTDTTEYVDGGGNTYSATVDTTNRTYSTSSYSTSGHLYIPNTTAVF